MSGFDRIKPPERRMLEREESRQPDAGAADRQGRAALFSASGEATTPGAGAMGRAREADRPARRRTSPLRVECDDCGATSPLDLGDVVRSAIPLVLIAPWRSHPVFARCPACGRRAWLRPGLGDVREQR